MAGRPHGYLFEREAIYEYILHEKAEIAQRTRAYEAELERSKVRNARPAGAKVT